MYLAVLTLAAGQQWSLVCGGDIMLNQVPFKGNPLAEVAPFLRSANLAIANLESPLTAQRVATSRKSSRELRERIQFLLKADPRFAQMLAKDGVRLVGMANNHCMDYGAAGLAQSIAALDGAKIGHSGAATNALESGKPVVYALPNGKRVGLICALAFVTAPAMLKCTPATGKSPGIAVLNLAGRIDHRARLKLISMVGTAKRSCDYLIVGLHWGVERKPLPIPYQVQLARALVDAGADVIWGHHPHVLQGAEIYKGKPILYSMGNLVSAMPAETALVKLRFKGDRFIGMEALPCIVHGGCTRPRPKSRALLRTLSMELLKRYPCKASRPWWVN